MNNDDSPLRPAIFEVDITNTIGKEYVEMFNDITRFVMVQIGIQVMLCMSDPDKFSIFTSEFVILLFFIIIGVLFYWLVLRKIIHFK